jgi:hypothetical protein
VITFRYHVVSLVAVLIALAVGIALGGGPLQRATSDGSAGDDESQTLVSTRAELDLLLESAGFADAYADQTADALLRDGLGDRAVTMLTLPGADDAHVSQLTDMIERAGGSVTARAAVDQKMLDVANRQLVSELATQMTDSAGKDVDMPAGVSGYEQMGHLLAHALVSRRTGGEPLDSVGESILAGLDTAELLTVTGTVDDRGNLVVVLAGDPYGSPDERAGAGSILVSLMSVLAERSDGLVLAGPVASSAQDGLVGSARADPTAADEVSTVDAVDRTAGAVVTVLALQAEAAGRSGHYGTGAAGDGAVPGAKSG